MCKTTNSLKEILSVPNHAFMHYIIICTCKTYIKFMIRL